ncbi:hypothetical protein AA0111_g11186 [Alternaria arborescens]|nr:hypothetical protein AA0111_g11186 [Alternaria arborescens]RYO17079.1 hypothetical protein AA0111_g11186 [Alternaria arborescens]
MDRPQVSIPPAANILGVRFSTSPTFPDLLA